MTRQQGETLTERRRTRKEAAAEIGIHPDTLKRLVAKGLVHHHRYPGTNVVYFTDADMIANDAAGQRRPEKRLRVVGRGSGAQSAQ